MDEPPFLAGIELGGTKSIAVLAKGRDIVEQVVVPTRGPLETLEALARQLAGWQGEHRFSALGIASFGPLQLDRGRPDFGRILDTPKPGWSGAAVADMLTEGLSCPWQIDTDVNASALAEFRWGGGKGCQSLCYVTIGTGVGGGLVIDGRPAHGAMHPEIGHLRLRRADGDCFEGACAFHGDCVEGLVSGPALAVRLGGDPSLLPDEDPRWRAVASDIAELAGAILLTVSAQRILVGGGVAMARPFLIALARGMLLERLGSYLPFLTRESVGDILREPAFGSNAGPMGAIALAMAAGQIAL
jgi:fructokinase